MKPVWTHYQQASSSFYTATWRRQGADIESARSSFFWHAGRGSYGSVYKAQVRGTQEVVAVKVIPLGDKDEVLEIQKEIEMLKECNHANVVRYLVSYLRSTCIY